MNGFIPYADSFARPRAMADIPSDPDASVPDADLAWASADPFGGLARALILGGIAVMVAVATSYILERTERAAPAPAASTAAR